MAVEGRREDNANLIESMMIKKEVFWNIFLLSDEEDEVGFFVLIFLKESFQLVCFYYYFFL